MKNKDKLQREKIFGVTAAILVLLSAMWNPLISAFVAILGLLTLLFLLYKNK